MAEIVDRLTGEHVHWRQAMSDALYGRGGFYARADRPGGAGGHFRTSVSASSLFATAILRLLVLTDAAMGRPATLDVVDVGAGGGRLLAQLSARAPAYLGRRLRLRAVEVAPRPADLPGHIGWSSSLPGAVHGLLIGTEWLDSVPLDVAVVGAGGGLRYLLVDPRTGAEATGEALTPEDAAWAERWWPRFNQDGEVRIELGGPRDRAWATAVAAIARGLAVTVDYGHTWDARPQAGTLTAFHAGRECAPVPDGGRDITAHVAMDSVAAAGAAVAGGDGVLLRQHEALAALGLTAARPAASHANRDPAGYVRALATATQAWELTDPARLGGHRWLLQPVGVGLPDVVARAASAGRR